MKPRTETEAHECGAISDTLSRIGDKWSVLVIVQLGEGPLRFGELRREIGNISQKMLTTAVRGLERDGFLTRTVTPTIPPRVDYELTERARDLIPVLAALARWGYEWSWSEPRRSEAIDIGAVFRLAPGLLTLPKSLRGTVELTVLQRSKDGEDRHYLLTIRRGDVTLEERVDADAGARITGTERAWVDALAPEGSHDALETEGDARLIAAVLDGVAPAITRAAAAA